MKNRDLTDYNIPKSRFELDSIEEGSQDSEDEGKHLTKSSIHISYAPTRKEGNHKRWRIVNDK